MAETARRVAEIGPHGPYAQRAAPPPRPPSRRGVRSIDFTVAGAEIPRRRPDPEPGTVRSQSDLVVTIC